MKWTHEGRSKLNRSKTSDHGDTDISFMLEGEASPEGDNETDLTLDNTFDGRVTSVRFVKKTEERTFSKKNLNQILSKFFWSELEQLVVVFFNSQKTIFNTVK